jgi:hypothetical protein
VQEELSVSDNNSYFAARAVEERRMAMASKDPIVRAVHLEMADRYAALAKSTGEVPLAAEMTNSPGQ